MKTIFTIISVIAFTIMSKAQVNLGVEYAKYTNNQTFSNDTIKTEFIIKNYGSTMYHTGDTIYVNAQINGVPFSLDLMSSNATPIVLTKMLHNGDTVHHNPGYILGSATLAYLAMMGAPSSTLNVCIIVWGKGLATVSNYGADINTANNITCVTYDPSQLGIQDAPVLLTNVFPNPVSNLASFQFAESGNYHICILNALGQQVSEKCVINDAIQTVDLTSFAEGLYTYTVLGENGQVLSNGKFIKR